MHTLWMCFLLPQGPERRPVGVTPVGAKHVYTKPGSSATWSPHNRNTTQRYSNKKSSVDDDTNQPDCTPKHENSASNLYSTELFLWTACSYG